MADSGYPRVRREGEVGAGTVCTTLASGDVTAVDRQAGAGDVSRFGAGEDHRALSHDRRWRPTVVAIVGDVLAPECGVQRLVVERSNLIIAASLTLNTMQIR